MLELALASALAAGITAPHLLALQRVPPMLTAVLWIFALALRAMVAIGAALFFFLYLPQTGLFTQIADWCWHEVLPVLATHLGLSGHPFAHAAVILPVLALAASLLWLTVGIARGWLSLHRQLRDSPGHGPWGSTVVAEPRILVAVTALGRARILLSPAALGGLDRDELRASVAHERAHLRRRHRPLLLAGSVLAALGRVLPGTRRAERELIFHLERDADQGAVRETHDPLALASAICKAAGASPAAGVVGLSGGGRVTRRLEVLVDGEPPRSALLVRLVAALVALLGAAVLTLAITLPAWALTAPASAPAAAAGIHGCPA